MENQDDIFEVVGLIPRCKAFRQNRMALKTHLTSTCASLIEPNYWFRCPLQMAINESLSVKSLNDLLDHGSTHTSSLFLIAAFHSGLFDDVKDP